MSKRRLINWLSLFGVWFTIAVLSAIETNLNYQTQGIEYNPVVQFFWSFFNWIPWFFVWPLIYWLTQRFVLFNNRYYRTIPIYLLAGVVITTVKVLIYFLFTLPLRTAITPTFFFTNFFDVLVVNFIGNYLVYLLLVLAANALQYFHEARKKEMRTLQLEAQLTRAQLQVLKMQLQPHFLFNTLNSISALIHKDGKLADTMITRLSDLLRTSLDGSDEQEILLSEEIDFLKNYLDIEKVRFQERLDVVMDIEPKTLNALVPNLILQPLVENAIKHGIAPYSRNGMVGIKACINNGMLELSVWDNGPGISECEISPFASGIGLSNTRERLERLYGLNHHFELRTARKGGFLVTIKIPMLQGE